MAAMGMSSLFFFFFGFALPADPLFLPLLLGTAKPTRDKSSVSSSRDDVTTVIAAIAIVTATTAVDATASVAPRCVHNVVQLRSFVNSQPHSPPH